MIRRLSTVRFQPDRWHPDSAGDAKAAWTRALCGAMAEAQLSGAKKLARHALLALWGSQSAYRDVKVGLTLQKQSQVRTLAPSTRHDGSLSMQCRSSNRQI